MIGAGRRTLLAAFAALAAPAAFAACTQGDGPADGTSEDAAVAHGMAPDPSPEVRPLSDRVEARMTSTSGRFAVAWRDLGSGDEILLHADSTFHAASMMKVPVMVRLFRMADEGRLDLERPVPVRNEFRSIEDGSLYSLSPEDDSDSTLYSRVGGTATARELIELMITRSSNLATNILIEIAGPDSIAAMLSGLGADGVRVLRGVEDIPAYRAGRNNTTTARGLLELFAAIAGGRAAGPESTTEMLAILRRQEFDDAIPAGLPAGTPVAHKTGWIPEVDHDGGIVFPPDGSPYVLVVLTAGVAEEAVTRAAAAHVSRVIWDWRTARRHGAGEPGARAGDVPERAGDAPGR